MYDSNFFIDLLYGVLIVLWPVFKVTWPILLIVLLVRFAFRR